MDRSKGVYIGYDFVVMNIDNTPMIVDYNEWMTPLTKEMIDERLIVVRGNNIKLDDSLIAKINKL